MAEIQSHLPHISSTIDMIRTYILSPKLAETQQQLSNNGIYEISGGYNNQIFSIMYEKQRYCLKCYKKQNAHKALREWNCLKLLASVGFLYSPQVISIDLEHQIPTLLMEYIDGVTVVKEALTNEQIYMLSEVLSKIYSVIPTPASRKIQPVIGNASNIIERISTWKNTIEYSSLDAEIRTNLNNWFNGQEPNLLLETAPSVLSRGDPNLSNCLWNGKHFTFIDFENSGWSDRAYDLADWVEHISGRTTPDETWSDFISTFYLSNMELNRFQAARKLFSCFWLMKLSNAQKNDLSVSNQLLYSHQLERVRQIFQ